MEENRLIILGNSHLQIISNQSQIVDKLVSLNNEVLGQIFLNRGLQDAKLHKYNKAVLNFTRAISAYPELVYAYTNRAQMYMILREWDNSLKDFCKAIELKPTDETYINRGKYFARIKQDQKELDDYISASIVNPKSKKAFHCLYVKYFKYLKDYEKAIDVSTKFINIDPSYHMGYLIRARTHFARGDYVGAIADLTKSVELFPMTTSYELRAKSYEMLNQHDRAKSDYKMALIYSTTTSS